MAVLKALPGAPDFKALPGSAKINGEPVKDNQSIKGKLISVKKSVINIGKFLDKSQEITKKQNEQFRKRDQNFKRKKKEERLEEPKKEWKKLVPKKIPGLSFFDSIKKFVSGWILGFIAIKLIPLLPKLIPIVINLGRFVNFVINVGGKFLNGFISFIDFGVKAGEATFGFLKNIGGEDFAKSFARFGGLLGTVLDLMLVVGGMTLMESLSGDDGGGGLFDLFGKKSTKTAAKTGVKSAGRSAITKLGRNALVKTLGKSGSKQFLKLTKNFVSPIVKKIPLIGALADFALNVFVFGESPGRAAFKAIGAGLGMWALGALGSFIPGLGTLIGATVGGIAGDLLGGMIYDMVFENKDNSKKKAYEKDEKENSRRRAVIATGATVTAGGALYAGSKSLQKQTAKTVAREGGEKLLKSGTKTVAREGGEKLLKSGTKKVVKSAAKASLKSSKNLISPIVKKIPFIGALVDFALNYFVFKEPLGKSAFMAIGAGLGAWVGGALGTLIPVPGVGTAIGAFVGGVGGDILGGTIYDMIFGGNEGSGPVSESSEKRTESVNATLQKGKVTSGNMRQSDAKKLKRQIELEKAEDRAISIYGFNSPEYNEVQKQKLILAGTPAEAIYTDKKGEVKVHGYSTVDGETKIFDGKKNVSGGGFKRAVGGFADYATLGMFDFDKQNRKGAPKDFGIRRMAGGLTDWATMGLTDFDKRGKGNLQFNPIGGGKDKAWGAANEQAKRREKQSGFGLKRGIGGLLDFATLGMFDFDKQNRRGAPKGFGIKRIVGGLADFVTAGATDFDKRGTGIGQMNLGEKMSKKKAYEKYLKSDRYMNKQARISNIETHPLDRKSVFGNVNDGKPISQRELYALAKSGDPEAIKMVEGMKRIQSKLPEGGSYTWNKETTLSNNQGSTTFKESYGSDTGSTDLKLGKQPMKFDEELLGVSASYETDGGQKEYTIYAPTTQINMLPGNNSTEVVVRGTAATSGDDAYEILEKGG